MPIPVRGAAFPACSRTLVGIYEIAPPKGKAWPLNGAPVRACHLPRTSTDRMENHCVNRFRGTMFANRRLGHTNGCELETMGRTN